MTDLRRRFRYHAWANRESLRSLRDAAEAGPLPERAEAIAAHLVASERLWLGRLGQAGGDAAQAVWPSSTLGEAESRLDDLARAWPAALDRVLADGLERPVTYTNSQGQTFTSAAGDILEHLLLHAHYHRGQIATLLGRAGRTPAATDFIVWVRSGEPGAG